MTPVGYITTILDLKKIIKDAEDLSLGDNAKIVFKDSSNDEYNISNKLLVGRDDKKTIYLEAE